MYARTAAVDENSNLKKETSSRKLKYPKDHWTLKTGYFEDPTPAMQVQTLPLEGPRSLGYHNWWCKIRRTWTLSVATYFWITRIDSVQRKIIQQIQKQRVFCLQGPKIKEKSIVPMGCTCLILFSKRNYDNFCMFSVILYIFRWTKKLQVIWITMDHQSDQSVPISVFQKMVVSWRIPPDKF